MVLEYKYREGHYTLAGLILLEILHIVVDQKVAYVTRVLALSGKVPKESRDKLLEHEDLYLSNKQQYYRLNHVFEEEMDKLALDYVPPNSLDTIKLLYTSDQSAEGTTVEASNADSTVSDAKNGGRQNV